MQPTQVNCWNYQLLIVGSLLLWLCVIVGPLWLGWWVTENSRNITSDGFSIIFGYISPFLWLFLDLNQLWITKTGPLAFRIFGQSPCWEYLLERFDALHLLYMPLLVVQILQTLSHWFFCLVIDDQINLVAHRLITQNYWHLLQPVAYLLVLEQQLMPSLVAFGQVVCQLS